MTPLILKALQFATKKHHNQVRKVSQIPYIVHPIAVSYLVAKYKGNSKNLESLLCAALLHDTLEDTQTTFNELSKTFNPLVASMVLELTSDTEEIEKKGKNEYLKRKMLGMSSYCLSVKLIDRMANISDNPTEKYKQDTKELLIFLKKNRKLNKTQKKIVKDLEEILG